MERRRRPRPIPPGELLTIPAMDHHASSDRQSRRAPHSDPGAVPSDRGTLEAPGWGWGSPHPGLGGEKGGRGRGGRGRGRGRGRGQSMIRRSIFGRKAEERYRVGTLMPPRPPPPKVWGDASDDGDAAAAQAAARCSGALSPASSEHKFEERTVALKDRGVYGQDHGGEGSDAGGNGSSPSLATHSTGDDTAHAANFGDCDCDGDGDGGIGGEDDVADDAAGRDRREPAADDGGSDGGGSSAGGVPEDLAASSCRGATPTTPARRGDGAGMDAGEVSPLTPYGHSPHREDATTEKRRHRGGTGGMIEGGYGSCTAVPRSTPEGETPSSERSASTTSSSSFSSPSSSADADPWTQSLHAQSLILALAFLFVWSPQNLMAPNLTQMAEYFRFTPGQRDLYLGANIAFATGVLSLPVSALIGFVADLVPSRKMLFAATVLVGGASSVCTGLSRTYAQLYFARFVCGGCMSGSVPVAFSLLGDLFDTADRNAASSGLTAMMGTGIILGQVYAGLVGTELGWREPFYLSGGCSAFSAALVLLFVRDPVRGGKERVMQDMLARGIQYDRKLTLGGFWHAMVRNESNAILMWQGFFSSVPWGIVFVFLNDYLSQEQGLSVPDATFLVFVFGIGCAVGGVLGGYLGQVCMLRNRSYLPLFMALTTFLGIGPYLALLDGTFHTSGPLPCFYAFAAGCVSSLPSVNVRPCLINVNPPHLRGATLTAANLIINCARGVGPSFITVMGGIWGVDRCRSFNVTLIVFWTITAVQLVFLARTLPRDQDSMEGELARYAESAIRDVHGPPKEGGGGGGGEESVSTIGTTSAAPLLRSAEPGTSGGGGGTGTGPAAAGAGGARGCGDDDTIVSIEDRMTSFDVGAARESLMFMSEALREIRGEVMHLRRHRGGGGSSTSSDRQHHRNHQGQNQGRGGARRGRDRTEGDRTEGGRREEGDHPAAGDPDEGGGEGRRERWRRQARRANGRDDGERDGEGSGRSVAAPENDEEGGCGAQSGDSWRGQILQGGGGEEHCSSMEEETFL